MNFLAVCQRGKEAKQIIIQNKSNREASIACRLEHEMKELMRYLLQVQATRTQVSLNALCRADANAACGKAKNATLH